MKKIVLLVVAVFFAFQAAGADEKFEKLSEVFVQKNKEASEIEEKYNEAEHQAFLEFKEADPESAFIWLEAKMFAKSQDALLSLQNSEEYRSFIKVLQRLQGYKDVEFATLEHSFEKKQASIYREHSGSIASE